MLVLVCLISQRKPCSGFFTSGQAGLQGSALPGRLLVPRLPFLLSETSGMLTLASLVAKMNKIPHGVSLMLGGDGGRGRAVTSAAPGDWLGSPPLSSQNRGSWEILSKSSLHFPNFPRRHFMETSVIQPKSTSEDLSRR